MRQRGMTPEPALTMPTERSSSSRSNPFIVFYFLTLRSTGFVGFHGSQLA
jgi:hypothetical protein